MQRRLRWPALGTTARKIWYVLSPGNRRFAVRVFIGLIVGMLVETISIGAVAPALAVLTRPAAAAETPTLARLLAALGHPSPDILIVGGLVCLLLVFGLKTLVVLALVWQQARFLACVRRDLSERLFETYLMQPWSFHLQRNSAELIRNATTEITLFLQGCHGVMMALAEACVTLGIAALLLWIEPVATLVVGVTLAIATWALQAALQSRLTRWGEMRQRAEGDRVKALQQGLGGVRDVKVFGREYDFTERFRAAERDAAHALRMQTFATFVPRLWYELLAVAGVAILGVVLFLQNMPAATLVARLGLFAVAAFRLMPSLTRIITSMQLMQFLEPAVNVLASELTYPYAAVRPNDLPRLPLEHGIELEHVTFRYPTASVDAISDLSLTIPRGESIGIIGESGAGKSTLVDMILGLIQPCSGRISVDGHDVSTNLRSWQNSIGYVPQSIYLTDDTIRANVAFGIPSERVDGEAVHRALAAAQLTGFVQGLPHGLDTMVGERGVRLSGGQLQRIGIARALYWDPPVLVLDEATSALDTETETGVMDAVNSLHGEKTLIIIAHRISTLTRCDKRFRLARGRLVDTADTPALSTTPRPSL